MADESTAPGSEEVVRPTGVDPTAEYDEDDELWTLHSYDEAGDPHGISRVWRRDGSLLEESSHRSGTPVFEKQFHPDGSLANERTFDATSGMPLTRTNFKGTEETDIRFPSGGLDEAIVKTHYAYNAHGYLMNWAGWDAAGNEIKREEIERSLDGATKQKSFASLQAASQDWNERGHAFYAALNAFVEALASEDENETDDEVPSDDRQDMERLVLRTLEEMNRDGRGAEVRELFRPSVEALSEPVWTGLGRSISKVCFVGEDIIVWADDGVYTIAGDRIIAMPGVIAFGASKNKRFVARCYDDRVEVADGVAQPPLRTLRYPKDYGPRVRGEVPVVRQFPFEDPSRLGITDVKVANDGGFAVLVTQTGTFLLDGERQRLLYPPASAVIGLARESEDEAFELEVSFPEAELSPDDRTIVVSGKFGDADPLRQTWTLDEALELTAGQSDSSDDLFTPSCFHSNGKHYLVGLWEPESFFGGGDETQVLTLGTDFVREHKESLLDGYEGTVSMRTERVCAAAEFGDRFLVGNADCYLWSQGIDENTQDYVFVGGQGRFGEITSIDVSPDHSQILVGTNYGMVWWLRVADSRGEGIITNMNVRDERRYLFLKTFEPMVW